MRQICLNRPFLWPQAVDTIAKNRRQIREIQLQFKHFNGRRLWPNSMGEEGAIKSGFWSQPIEVHFISDQNLCRRRLLCVEQDIFWHLHGINQKRRRPPTQLYICIYAKSMGSGLRLRLVSSQYFCGHLHHATVACWLSTGPSNK